MTARAYLEAAPTHMQGSNGRQYYRLNLHLHWRQLGLCCLLRACLPSICPRLGAHAWEHICCRLQVPCLTVMACSIAMTPDKVHLKQQCWSPDHISRYLTHSCSARVTRPCGCFMVDFGACTQSHDPQEPSCWPWAQSQLGQTWICKVVCAHSVLTSCCANLLIATSILCSAGGQPC